MLRAYLSISSIFFIVLFKFLTNFKEEIHTSVRLCICAAVRLCVYASVRLCGCVSLRPCVCAAVRLFERASVRPSGVPASLRLCACAPVTVRLCDYETVRR